MSEAVPLGRILGRIGADDAARRWIVRAGRDALIEGTEEAGQEAFQQTMGNLIAREMYDEERELFDKAVAEGAELAFAMNAGVPLHVETLYADNNHLIAES